MKKTLVLLSSFLAGSAFAQGTTHMFEFNADSMIKGLVSIDKSKTKGNNADNNLQFDMNLNYAYQLPSLPQLQLATRFNYNKGTTGGRGDFEDYGLAVGGIYNFNPGMSSLDLTNAMYISLYVGFGWNHNYTSPRSTDEVLSGTVAVGRRFSLEPIGLKHITWSPEVAFQNLNSTTGSQLQYSQSLQFRVLQFSAFF
jgi:hypothetical protein